MAAAETPVQDAARADKRLAVMVALRQRIAVELDDPGLSTRDLAALSKRVMEIQNEIDAIRAADGGSGSGDQPGGGGGLGAAVDTPDEAFSAT